MKTATPRGNEIRASEDPLAFLSPKPIQIRPQHDNLDVLLRRGSRWPFAMVAVGPGSLACGGPAHPGTNDIAWDVPSIQATLNTP